MDKYALVYKGLPPNMTCCDSTLRILPNGEWIVVFMTGSFKEPDIGNHIQLSRSRNQGYVWEPAEIVLKFEDKACVLTEVVVHQQKLTMYIQTHDGEFGDWQVWTITSNDNGHTWSEIQSFEPMPRCVYLRNLYIASWGEWILPFQAYDHRDDLIQSPWKMENGMQGYNGAFYSADEGKTWGKSNSVGPTKGWAENNVTELSNGILVMLIRADGKGYLLRSESRDRGRTWSDPMPTDIPNPGTKFRLHRLSDGRIVLIHNPNPMTKHPNSKYQAACHRNPLAMWISDNDMASWDYKRILTDFPGMLAYPDGVVDENETFVHFAFDYNRHDVIYWGAKLPK